jgi:hypothetical protein
MFGDWVRGNTKINAAESIISMIFKTERFLGKILSLLFAYLKRV